MDQTSLEKSIRHECEEDIKLIHENEIQQLRRLDIECQAAIDSIRKTTQDETDAHIRQERSRLENKARLDRQKRELQAMENFITRQVDDVMTGMRQHPRYRPFLLEAVSEAIRQIRGRVEVRLSPNDHDLQQDIQSQLKKEDLTLINNPAIRWGGCLVIDQDGGRIFNSTLERIYFRRSGIIRRMVAKMISGQAPQQNINATSEYPRE